MVLSHDDTKDILQEVFLRVWKNISSFKGDSKLFTWLYKITTNEVSRFLDRKKRMLKKNEVLQEIMQNELVNSHLISGDEIQIKLQKAILQLPHKQQLVFNLRYFDDMNYEDIAEILETSVESLKVSYHYACKKITVQLNNEIV
jgi:RNA polymerase sigma-70 factor (ECF subfamily)